jgi:broad specificity phosphatase PhoE
LRLIEDSRLSNILVPRWAGRLESELEGEEDWRLFLNEPLEFFPAGGESIVEVVKRIDSFIDDLDRGPTPIIVSHTTPLQVLWLRALGLPLENLWLTEFKFHALTMVVGGCLEVQNLPWRAEVGSLELLGQ